MRPVWLQGSRVTTAVPPRARSPACGSATDLGVRPAGVRVEALADDLAGGVEQHAADDGVGAGGAEAARGQLDRAPHRASSTETLAMPLPSHSPVARGRHGGAAWGRGQAAAESGYGGAAPGGRTAR